MKPGPSVYGEGGGKTERASLDATGVKWVPGGACSNFMLLLIMGTGGMTIGVVGRHGFSESVELGVWRSWTPSLVSVSGRTLVASTWSGFGPKPLRAVPSKARELGEMLMNACGWLQSACGIRSVFGSKDGFEKRHLVSEEADWCLAPGSKASHRPVFGEPNTSAHVYGGRLESAI